jgi:hypothetical protein
MAFAADIFVSILSEAVGSFVSHSKKAVGLA